MTVRENLQAQAKRKMLLAFALFFAWILITAVGKALDYAAFYTIGQPIFLFFFFGLIYLALRRPVRCPSCGAAVYFFAGWLKPSWAPAWSEPFFSDARYCAYCAVPFSSEAALRPRCGSAKE